MRFDSLFSTRLAASAASVFLVTTISATEARAQDIEWLFFSTDVHDRAGLLFDQVEQRCTMFGPNVCELIGLVGDYNYGDPNSYYSNETDIFATSMGIYQVFDWNPGLMNLVFTQGNHDSRNSQFTMGFYPTGPVSLEGNDYYDVYRINVSDFADAADDLEDFFETASTDKMHIVLCHYPLHSRRSDINEVAATDIFNKMDTAATQGHDITFLWGHNHYRENRPDYDKYTRMVALPGETIQTGNDAEDYNTDVATRELKITYLNAGYAKDESPDSGSSVLLALSDSWMYIFRYGTDSEARFLWY